MLAPTGASPSAEAGTPLNQDLGWALGVVFRAYMKATEATVARLPGGPRGYQVLTAATQGLASTQLALANHLGIDRTVMTYLLDDLEREGLIERQPDPADRRARRIVATDNGRDLLSELWGKIEEIEARVLSALEDEERAVFRNLLLRLASPLEVCDVVPGACSAAEELTPPPGAPRRRARR